MKISDWIVENMTGKIDGAAVFDGMDNKARRNPEKRMKYVADRAAEYATKFAEMNNKRQTLGGDTDEYTSQAYRYFILKTLYSSRLDDIRTHTERVERATLNFVFNALPQSDDVQSPLWHRAISLLNEDRACRELLPSVFDKRFATDWENFKLEKKRKQDAAEAERRAKHERNANIRAGIAQLEDELARLNSMFHNSRGADQMTRYKLIISIESTEDAIRRLRDAL